MLALSFVHYWQTMISQPERAALPALVIEEHVTSHSAGFRRRKAVRDLPCLAEESIPIIANMFPDGCRRANFEAPVGYALLCAPEAGDDAIVQALAESGEIFVLTDNAPLIGGRRAGHHNPHSVDRGTRGSVSTTRRITGNGKRCPVTSDRTLIDEARAGTMIQDVERRPIRL